MKERSDFKSQLISMQKPRKRRAKANPSRYKVDLIELHRNIIETKEQRRPAKSILIRGVIFALIAALSFFLLGYLIAALSIPMWAKILLLTFAGTLGFVSSRILMAVLH